MSAPLALALLLAAVSGAEEFDPKALKAAIQAQRALAQAKPAGGALEVVLNRFKCAGADAAPADLAQDLADAQAIFRGCGVKVVLGRDEEIKTEDGGPCPGNFKFEVDHDAKVLSPSQRALIARYHRVDSGLSVFYLPWSSMGPSQAGTSIPADYLKEVKGDNPTDRGALGVLAVFQKARVRMGAKYTLAHEMGHVLTGNSRHETAPGNLMESAPGGRTLTKEQCGRVAASPFVRSRN